MAASLLHIETKETECKESLVHYMSWGFILCGLGVFWRQSFVTCALYGRYVNNRGPPRLACSSKLAWFLQELPAFLAPVFLLQTTTSQTGLGRRLLLWTFCLHYFQRTFIYALLTRGRPVPLRIVVFASMFCTLNGFLQGHYLLHCAQFQDTWMADVRLAAGLLMFVVGMTINIHSDHILRSLRRPGEIVYRIPHGGMFEYVSGANYFGEVLEWCGYAVATWSFPTFSFAFVTICSVGPRAFHHHRDYRRKFDNYPQSRKAIIPFIL